MDIEKMLKEITAAYNNFDYQSHLKQPDELYHYTSLNTLQIILKNIPRRSPPPALLPPAVWGGTP